MLDSTDLWVQEWEALEIWAGPWDFLDQGGLGLVEIDPGVHQEVGFQGFRLGFRLIRLICRRLKSHFKT